MNVFSIWIVSIDSGWFNFGAFINFRWQEYAFICWCSVLTSYTSCQTIDMPFEAKESFLHSSCIETTTNQRAREMKNNSTYWTVCDAPIHWYSNYWTRTGRNNFESTKSNFCTYKTNVCLCASMISEQAERWMMNAVVWLKIENWWNEKSNLCDDVHCKER